MDKTHLIKTIFLFLLISVPGTGTAQRIENVRTEVEGEEIHIYYDLLGVEANSSVIVKVYLSTDGGDTYGKPLRSVSGDIGIVTGAGKDRCIVWDVFRDVDELVSVNVKFKVRAEPLKTEQALVDPGRIFKIDINTNIGSKSILDYNSYGINIKGCLYLNQLGIGLRADYYKTYRAGINYSHNSTFLTDTGSYWGYSGGAIIEYDFIKNDKYSLYPFLYIGQSKINYEYNPEYRQDDFFKYSVFGSLGLGFDIQAYRFLYLGIELEYLVSPWLDIVPSPEPDEGLDGFSIGFAVKFVIDTG